MKKTYIEDIKLAAIRNKIFSSLSDKEQINIFDAITLSSGDYLPTPKMIDGEFSVYGGGGTTVKKHNEYNVELETFGIGRVGARCGCVFKIKSKSWVTDNALFASKIDDSFEIEFLIHFLNFKNLNQFANTAAQPVISLKRIAGITLPKIDLNLQNEIVEILNRVENGIIEIADDKYGIRQTLNFVSSKEELSTELTHQLTLVKKLRQQLLQDAVQGKLVKQNPNDEPASELLKKIKAKKEKLIAEKKIKKEKELPPIKPGEIPFEIPESWVWCRLGEIALNSEAGKSYQADEVIAQENEWAVIKTSAITSGVFIEDENKRLPNQKENLNKIKIEVGNILFCRASGSKGLAGKSCLVEIETKAKLILSDKSIRYIFSNNISKKYIHLYNSSLFGELYYQTLGTKKSTTMNNITREQFNNLPIPLPPLSEQNRIVQKLDDLMQYCKNLGVSIQQSAAQNEKLLQQVLREALQSNK